MRNDLTTAFLQKLNEEVLTPIQFLVIHFEIADKYISDRLLNINSVECLDIVENWGSLTTVGNGDFGTLETRQISISLWNGGDIPFSENFHYENPLNLKCDLYQTFEGLTFADAALIGSFVIQDPIQYSENNRLLLLDLVSENMLYQANVGNLLTIEQYPYALKRDINKGIDIIIGTPGEVSCLYAKAPLTCTQKGTILKLPTTLNVVENLDELGWSNVGFLRLGQEIVKFDSRTTYSFNINLRGAKGTNKYISEHADNSPVTQWINDHTFLIGEGPLTSVSKVKVQGYEVDPSKYVVDFASNSDLINGIISVPFEKIEECDAGQKLNFNNVFNDWSGTPSVPVYWAWTHAGNNTVTQETTIKRVGNYSIKFYSPDNASSYMNRNIILQDAQGVYTPLKGDFFVAGFVDIYISEWITGNPGVMIRMFYSASLYREVKVAADKTIIGQWQRVYFRSQLNPGEELYRLYIYLMATWSSMLGGLFRGTVYYDQIKFGLFDGATQDKTYYYTSSQYPLTVYGLENKGEKSAKITFPNTPEFVEYESSATTLDIDFDAIDPVNLAYAAHYAYQEEEKAQGAVLSKDFTPLAIKQVDIHEDVGEIIRAFLVIEHWETKYYKIDKINVEVEGLGVIGTLTRPSSKDGMDVVAEVTLDHGHWHLEGVEHKHNFTNPSIGVNDPGHPHSANSDGIKVETRASVTYWPIWLSLYSTVVDPITHYVVGTKSVDCWIPYVQNWWKQEVGYGFFGTTGAQVTVYIGFAEGGGAEIIHNSQDALQRIYYQCPPGKTAIYLRCTMNASGVANAYFQLGGAWVVNTYQAIINPNSTGINANLGSNADVILNQYDANGNLIKGPNDVLPVTDTKSKVDFLSKQTATRTIIDKFDLTQGLQTIGWDWFNDRTVKLNYVGVAEIVEIVVVHCYLQVEYKKRIISKSDIVTCFPVGTLPNRPDKVIEHLLNIKAKLPLDRMGSIGITPNPWDDDTILDDDDIWIDDGLSLNIPADAVFEQAGAAFSYLKYKFDGVIKADLNIWQVIPELCKQSRSRLIWENGLAKLSLNRTSIETPFLKGIDSNDLQLKSIKTNFGLISNVINKINIKYFENTIENDFDKNCLVQDLASIDKNGEKEKKDFWNFNFVRNDLMALDLANYYIWQYGESISEYTFNTYLSNFDIEKQDGIKLSSHNGYDYLVNYPLIVKDVKRIFGSGKNHSINLIEITGINVRTNKIVIRLEDVITIVDNTELTFKDGIDFIDSFVLIDDNILIERHVLTYDYFYLTDIIETTFNSIDKLIESLSIVDSISVEQTMELQDTFALYDPFVQLEAAQGFGFVPFGTGFFGSNIGDTRNVLDVFYLNDEVEITLTEG